MYGIFIEGMIFIVIAKNSGPCQLGEILNEYRLIDSERTHLVESVGLESKFDCISNE